LIQGGIPTGAAAATNEFKEGLVMSKTSKPTVGRREFLRVLAAGTGAAATAATPLATNAAAAESEQDKRKPRYKETDHVKAYYRVNRYPG
jgi:hypothetical protein